MKFGSEPKLKEQPVEKIELGVELEKDIEDIGERTGDLVLAEVDLEEEIPKGKLIELRKSGKLMKTARALTLVTVLMGVGGMANKAEAGSWNTKKKQTAGDVFKDIGIQVGGAILRNKVEASYEKDQARIQELRDGIPTLEEMLEKKKKELQSFSAQEAAGADMSDMRSEHEQEIERLRVGIEQKIAELNKLEKGGSVWKNAAREGIRRIIGGQGSWRSNR